MVANDNCQQLYPSIDLATVGQALRIKQPHRKFGQAYAEFVSHVGDGKHVMVRKLISSMWKARWTKPMRVARVDVTAVHLHLAKS